MTSIEKVKNIAAPGNDVPIKTPGCTEQPGGMVA